MSIKLEPGEVLGMTKSLSREEKDLWTTLQEKGMDVYGIREFSSFNCAIDSPLFDRSKVRDHVTALLRRNEVLRILVRVDKGKPHEFCIENQSHLDKELERLEALTSSSDGKKIEAAMGAVARMVD